jgi:hypothetical protein
MPNENKMIIFNESTKDKDATAPHFEGSCRQFKKMYDDTQTDSAPIPENNLPEDWEVHATHCCEIHGCKYNDNECPIVNGRVQRAKDTGWCQEPCLFDDPNSCRR